MRKVTRHDLERACDIANQHYDDTGDAVPLTDGHTIEGAPESAQPPIVGYAANFRVEPFFETGRYAIVADCGYDRDFDPNSRPRTSIEIGDWGNPLIDPIALLGATTPARKLGLALYQAGGKKYRYNFDPAVPQALPLTPDNMPPTSSPVDYMVEQIIAKLKNTAEWQYLTQKMNEVEPPDPLPEAEPIPPNPMEAQGGLPPGSPPADEPPEEEPAQPENSAAQPKTKMAGGVAGATNSFVPSVKQGKLKMAATADIKMPEVGRPPVDNITEAAEHSHKYHLCMAAGKHDEAIDHFKKYHGCMKSKYSGGGSNIPDVDNTKTPGSPSPVPFVSNKAPGNEAIAPQEDMLKYEQYMQAGDEKMAKMHLDAWHAGKKKKYEADGSFPHPMDHSKDAERLEDKFVDSPPKSHGADVDHLMTHTESMPEKVRMQLDSVKIRYAQQQQEIDALKADNNALKLRYQRERREKDLTQLEAEGYQLDRMEELTASDYMHDQAWTGHCEKIRLRYRRAPIGGPQFRTDTNPSMQTGRQENQAVDRVAASYDPSQFDPQALKNVGKTGHHLEVLQDFISKANGAATVNGTK